MSKKFHFIAIGGVGMSGLAKFLIQQGYTVSGSDVNDSKYVKQLKEMGIDVLVLDHHEADYISELALIKIHVKGKMILRSTRTLKPVDYYFSEREELTCSFYQDEDLNDENIIFVEDDKIDIDEEVISLIITSIPIKIIGKDEPEHFEGDGYEVMSEDEYYQKDKENKIDPRFASLSSLLDEEE